MRSRYFMLDLLIILSVLGLLPLVSSKGSKEEEDHLEFVIVVRLNRPNYSLPGIGRPTYFMLQNCLNYNILHFHNTNRLVLFFFRFSTLSPSYSLFDRI